MDEPFADTSDTEFNAALDAISAPTSELQLSSRRTRRQPAIQFAFLDFPDAPTDCDAATGCCASVVTPTTELPGIP